MEVLNRIMKKTEERGFIQGFHVGPINSTGIRVSRSEERRVGKECSS